jgi:hypothetical protein
MISDCFQSNTVKKYIVYDYLGLNRAVTPRNSTNMQLSSADRIFDMSSRETAVGPTESVIVQSDDP